MKRKYKRTSKRTGKYKSGLENTVAEMLKRKNAKYEVDKLSYVIPKTYTPDFTIVNPDGHKWFIEVKGWHRHEDQVKMRMVKMAHPDKDIRFFFPKNNKVQGSSLTNSEWCEKYDYKYCIGKIPSSWFGKNQRVERKKTESII